MWRWLLLFLPLAGAGLTAGAPARRVLDGARHHLGVAGLPEWEEFVASTPHGRQLDVMFSAAAQAGESTLLLWQREVKANWTVQLNGRKLGVLEPLSPPVILALAVPPGVLRDGENRLTILRPPSVMLDDIVVGDISLDLRPRSEVLAEASLEVVVTDADSGAAVPCRLTVVNGEGALWPLTAAAGQRLAVRTGVVYTGDGRARLGLPAGAVTLTASRGFEYSIATARLALAAGESRRIALSVRREVPTPGLVACDTHIHTLTLSKHGDATLEDRMLTIAGEGIELAVATEHNHHADYGEVAARVGLKAHFTPVVGNEVSTRIGHFNAFPVDARAAPPEAQAATWAELLPRIRQLTGARVITLNHPRDVHSGFTPLAPENFEANSGALRAAPEFACDAIEVVTSAALQSDVMQLYRDWFALLNHGYRLAAIGASDTHHVSQFILGQARTYAVCQATDPGNIDLDEIVASYRAGRLFVSMGLLVNLQVDHRHHVGDLATALGPELHVTAEVSGPSWIDADRVELLANGICIREQGIEPGPRVQKAVVSWILPRPRHDIHLVAIASGPGGDRASLGNAAPLPAHRQGLPAARRGLHQPHLDRWRRGRTVHLRPGLCAEPGAAGRRRRGGPAARPRRL